MNWLRFSFVMATTLVVVFLQTTVNGPRFWLGAQLDLVPSLVVFASGTGDFVSFMACAMAGGLCLDCFSANPLGTTMLPLLAAGCIVHRVRELVVLQDQLVQGLAGFSASLLVSVLSITLVVALGRQPLVGWISVWQCLVVAAASAAATPVWFWLFPRLEKTFGYVKMPETSFRPDREIKRGRG
jgi:rod shape-determining protein MreD